VVSAHAEHAGTRRILARKLRRDMARSRWQFVAVVATIFLGIALYGATADAYRNLVASYDATYAQLRLADYWSVGGDVDGFAADARTTDGVAAVTTRVVADLPMSAGGTTFEGRVVGMPPGEQPAVDAVLVEEGSYLASGDPEGVLVERHMADAFDVGVGDSVTVLGPDGPERLTVRGIAASAEYLWPARDRQEVLAPPDSFGVVFAGSPLAADLAPPGGGRQATVRYASGSDTGALDDRMARLAREAGAVDDYTRAEQPSVAVLQEDLDGFSELSYLFPILFLGAAGLAAYVLLTRLVDRQRPVIGMLAANGFRHRAIFGHYVAFGLIAGLLGAVPGIVAGGALGALISGVYTDFVSVPITEIRLHLVTGVVGLAFGLAVGFLCAAAPALSASRETPAAAMRGVIPPPAGRRTILERIVPAADRLPIRWVLVLRNLARSPRRTLYTVIGVIVALCLVLVSWGMLDSVNALLDDQERIERADAIAIPADGDAGGIVGPIRGVAGVSHAEELTSLQVSLGSGERSYATTITGYPRETRMHVFEVEGAGTEELPESGLYVGAAIAGELGVGVGDTIDLAFPATGAHSRAEIAGFVEEPLGTFAYATRDTVGRLSGLDRPNQVAALIAPGADGDAVRERIEQVPGVAAVSDPQGVVATMRSFLALFYVMVGVMLVFGALMAFAIIFATMSVNIAERRAEIAALRAEGVELGMLRRLLGTENLVMVTLGIVPGLVVGALLSWAFLSSFNSDQFTFPFAISPLALGVSAGAILLVAILSQIPALRGIRRLDVARVLRERAA
jgi:putative ABC transport system permease protein